MYRGGRLSPKKKDGVVYQKIPAIGKPKPHAEFAHSEKSHPTLPASPGRWDRSARVWETTVFRVDTGVTGLAVLAASTTPLGKGFISASISTGQESPLLQIFPLE